MNIDIHLWIIFVHQAEQVPCESQVYCLYIGIGWEATKEPVKESDLNKTSLFLCQELIYKVAVQADGMVPCDFRDPIPAVCGFMLI